MKLFKNSDDTGATLLATVLTTLVLFTVTMVIMAYGSTSFMSVSSTKAHVARSYDADAALKTAIATMNKSDIDADSHQLKCPTTTVPSAAGDFKVECQMKYESIMGPTTALNSSTGNVTTPDNPGFRMHPGDSYTLEKSVVVPERTRTVIENTTVSKTPEVLFLADTTISMQSSLNNVESSVLNDTTGILAKVLAKNPTAKFGVAEYRDVPTSGAAFPAQTNPTMPQSTDPYRATAALGAPLATVKTSVANWKESPSTNGSIPEAGFYALFKAADLWVGPDTPAPEVQRILVWFGDAPSKDTMTIGGVVYDRAKALAELKKKHIKVLSVSVHSTQYPLPSNTANGGVAHADPDPYWGKNTDLNADPADPSKPSTTRASVKYASTGNVALAANRTAPVLDGVAVIDNDRVLLKNQSDERQNGTYTVNYDTVDGQCTVYWWTGGPCRTYEQLPDWSFVRAGDANANGELKLGDWLVVTAGRVQAGTSWKVSAVGSASWRPGTDTVSWAPYVMPGPSYLAQGVDISNQTNGVWFTGVDPSQVSVRILEGLETLISNTYEIPTTAHVTAVSSCSEVTITPVTVTDTNGVQTIRYKEVLKQGDTDLNCTVRFFTTTDENATPVEIPNSVETNTLRVETKAKAFFTAKNAAGVVVGKATATYNFTTTGHTMGSVDSWELS